MPYRVLIVEDDENSRRLLEDLLSASGYDTLAVGSGERCVEEILAWTPNLLLLDIGLPGIDGIETLARVRAIEGFGQIPALAITAAMSQFELNRITDLTFNGYHAKPININGLLSQVRELLTSK
jgi:two-component system, cell cycle response regulator DivK